MASLFVILGRDQGKKFELNEAVNTLGRDASNRIQLFDTEVSRRHAEVRRDGDGYAVVDLNSANGTFVNSDRVARRVLTNGDRVQVGRTLMLYTGVAQKPDENLAEMIDIVGAPGESNVLGGRAAGDQSRIVKSLRQQDGSDIFSGVDASQSPWLARTRSNLQIMYRTALAVSHTLDIDQLLARIMDLIFEWVETDRGCIMLRDHHTDELVPKVLRSRQPRQGDAAAEKINISGTILNYVLEHKEGVLTSDAREDERWDPAGSIVSLGVREAICVPMQGRYGIVGVIYIDTYTPPGRSVQNRGGNKFTEEHLKLMVAIGHQAALAIEDTSYYSAMVQAERLAAVGQTIAMLSHHIKNILQGIRGGSYLIQEGLKSDEPDVVRKGWAIVEKNQEKISNLVMDMLSFSKEREPDPVPSDLNQTVADVIELMQARAAENRVQLAWQPAAELPELIFDPEALHRAVLNVVTNAIDACEKTDAARVAVTVQYKPEDRLAVIVVEDNGSGIEPQDLKRIFAVFESRKGSRGTGLGLPVSQKIFREHGGDILVESTPGAGSRFTMQLPAVLAESRRTAAAERGGETSAG